MCNTWINQALHYIGCISFKDTYIQEIQWYPSCATKLKGKCQFCSLQAANHRSNVCYSNLETQKGFAKQQILILSTNVNRFQQNYIMFASLNYSPTHSLDKKLDPIFQHIRKRKIFNIHQLKLRDGQEKSLIMKEANSLTLPIFNLKNQKAKKLRSLRIRQPVLSLAYDRSLQKVISQKSNGNQKVIFVSSVSKVKRHLIQTIDYKGIEKALYRKSQRKTLYQQFYQTMLQKDKWLKQTHPGFFQSQTIDSQDTRNRNNGEQKQVSQKELYQKKGNMFRSVPKKIGTRLLKGEQLKKSSAYQSSP